MWAGFTCDIYGGTKRCVAGGCSSTCKDGLHLYCFPKDPELSKVWVDEVKQTGDKWEPDTIRLTYTQVTGHSYQCSKCFEDDCFQPYTKLAGEWKRCIAKDKCNSNWKRSIAKDRCNSNCF